MEEEYCSEHKMLLAAVERLDENYKEMGKKIDEMKDSLSSLPWKITGAVGGLIVIAEGILRFVK